MPGEYINKRYKVDMRDAPPASKTNAAGYARNQEWFWQQMLDQHPELFSAKNRTAIRRGAAPVVDDAWIKYHPNHASFKGDVLDHHHIDQGPEAVGLPQRVHKKWHGDLHPDM